MEVAGPLGTPLGLARRLRGRGCANCQSLPQAELFVRQRERPGLRVKIFFVQFSQRRRAKRSYSTFKVRRGGREEIPLVQGTCPKPHGFYVQPLVLGAGGPETRSGAVSLLT